MLKVVVDAIIFWWGWPIWAKTLSILLAAWLTYEVLKQVQTKKDEK